MMRGNHRYRKSVIFLYASIFSLLIGIFGIKIHNLVWSQYISMLWMSYTGIDLWRSKKQW